MALKSTPDVGYSLDWDDMRVICTRVVHTDDGTRVPGEPRTWTIGVRTQSGTELELCCTERGFLQLRKLLNDCWEQETVRDLLGDE